MRNGSPLAKRPRHLHSRIYPIMYPTQQLHSAEAGDAQLPRRQQPAFLRQIDRSLLVLLQKELVDQPVAGYVGVYLVATARGRRVPVVFCHREHRTLGTKWDRGCKHKINNTTGRRPTPS